MYHLDSSTSPATAAPALANFALLMADGSALKYVEILNDLYMDNGLSVPDFSRYLPQSEQDQTDVTSCEEDISFMAELDENHNTGFVTTSFTKAHYEICHKEAGDLEDWFDIDEGICDVNVCCMESSTPILTHRKSLPSDLKSKLLDRNFNLLFNLTVKSIPDQVLDNAIQQAEDLNETVGYPKLCIDFSSPDKDDDTFQQSDETNISFDSDDSLGVTSSDSDNDIMQQSDDSMQQPIDDLEDISGEDDIMQQIIENMKVLIENATEQLDLPSPPIRQIILCKQTLKNAFL